MFGRHKRNDVLAIVEFDRRGNSGVFDKKGPRFHPALELGEKLAVQIERFPAGQVDAINGGQWERHRHCGGVNVRGVVPPIVRCRPCAGPSDNLFLAGVGVRDRDLNLLGAPRARRQGDDQHHHRKLALAHGFPLGRFYPA